MPRSLTHRIRHTALLIISMFMLASCAKPQVFQLAADSYVANGASEQRYKARQVALQSASDYCRELNRVVQVTNIDTVQAYKFEVDVYFKCIDILQTPMTEQEYRQQRKFYWSEKAY